MSELHRPISRRSALALAATAATGLATGTAWAQSFPSKTVTLVVPYTAGGSADIGARMVAPELSKLLGQPVVVDNVAGASGAIGVQKVLRSAPDGYTLLCGGLSETMLIPMTNPALNYKSEDLVPLAFSGSSPVALVVRPDFPANTVDEFVEYARKNPGKLSFGSAGVGSFGHVMTEVIKDRANLFMVHIPYRGGANILSDVIGGQIDMAVTALVSANSMVQAKRVKLLGVSSRERVPGFKDVQTLAESRSLKGLDMQVWSMLFAPVGTPEPVVAKLSAALNTALVLPSMKEARAKIGADLPQVMNPAQAKAFLAGQQSIYRAVLSRIKPE